jgi:hypothetical protein
MNSSNVELSTILDRIIDKAADNLRFAKLIVQLGLDPDNVTYDAIFNRLLEIFLAAPLAERLRVPISRRYNHSKNIEAVCRRRFVERANGCC